MIRRLIRNTAVVAAYAALTVFAARRAFRSPGRRVMGWPGDQFLFLWTMGWYRHCLKERKNPLLVDRINPPHGVSLGSNESAAALSVLALPFVRKQRYTLAYNFCLFVSFVGSAYSLYRWVYSKTGDLGASFAAGALFAFSPNRMLHANGHLAQVSTQLLPFLFWNVDELATREKVTIGQAMKTGLILGGVTGHCAYLGYQSGIASIVHLLTGLFRNRGSSFAFFVNCLAYLFFAAIFSGLAMIPNIHAFFRKEVRGHHPEEIDKNSADLLDWFLPTRSQFFWRKIGFAFRRPMGVERTLYLGIVPVIFAAYAVRRGSKSRGGDGISGRLAAAAAGCMLLAHGPRLRIGGARTRLKLPGALMYRWVPGYRSTRVSARFGFFVSMYTCALMGIGIARAKAGLRTHRVSAALPISAIFLGLLDFDCSPIQTTKTGPREVDRWLANQPKGNVLELPPGHFVERQIYGTLFHPHPVVGTLHPVNRPPVFREFCRLYWKTPEKKLPEFFVTRDIRYVLVHPPAFQDRPELREAFQESKYVWKIDQIGDVTIYILRSVRDSREREEFAALAKPKAPMIE